MAASESEPQWNPPPPQAGAGDNQEGEGTPESPDIDAIGDTAFSKSWVLSMLVKAVALVDKDKEGAPPEKKPAFLQIVDRERVLDEEIETDLCRLLDASVNEAVAYFLHEKKTVPLIIGAVKRSEYARLSEILTGVLANMACFEPICKDDLCSTEFMEDIIRLLDEPETSLVVETIRVIMTCLSHESTRPAWLTALKESRSARSDLTFVMQNCVNVDLLKCSALLVDRVFDLDAELMEKWATHDMIDGLCAAAEQTKMTDFDIMTSIVLTLQLFCTFSVGIALLMREESTVGPVLDSFLTIVSRLKEPSELQSRALTAALTVADYVLVEHQAETTAEIMRGKVITKFLERLRDEGEEEEAAAKEGGAEGEPKTEGEREKPSEGAGMQDEAGASSGSADQQQPPPGAVQSDKMEEESQGGFIQGVSFSKGGARDKFCWEGNAKLAKRIIKQLSNTKYYKPPKPKAQPREREVSRFVKGNVLFRIVVDDDEGDD